MTAWPPPYRQYPALATILFAARTDRVQRRPQYQSDRRFAQSGNDIEERPVHLVGAPHDLSVMCDLLFGDQHVQDGRGVELALRDLRCRLVESRHTPVHTGLRRGYDVGQTCN